jgi:hypothetical protein
MKSLFILFMFVSFLAPFQAKANYTPAAPCTVRVCFEISGKIGSRITNCESFGLSCLKITFCKQVANQLQNPSPGTVRIIFEQVSPSEVKLTFLNVVTSKSVFVIDEATAFGSSICTALGYKSITAVNGSYAVTRNSDGTLSSKIKVLSK